MRESFPHWPLTPLSRLRTHSCTRGVLYVVVLGARWVLVMESGWLSAALPLRLLHACVIAHSTHSACVHVASGVRVDPPSSISFCAIHTGYSRGVTVVSTPNVTLAENVLHNLQVQYALWCSVDALPVFSVWACSNRALGCDSWGKGLVPVGPM